MTDARQTKINYHQRTITDLKYNKDGDLLFVSSKDATASVTRDYLLGTYSGHEGAINVMDINNSSTLLATGGADKKLIVWDVETGTKLKEHTLDSMVKSISFFDNKIIYITDDSFNASPKIGLLNDNVKHEKVLGFVPTKGVIDYTYSKIVVGDETGRLHKLNMDFGVIDSAKTHNGKIINIKNSYCDTFMVTSSSDCTSKIVDYNLNTEKTYVTEESVNCSAIFRSNDILVNAGGMSARDVTTTSSKSGFSVNFFDVVDGKMKGSYTTHFGTINALDVHPSCKKYASGGEDAAVFIVEFGDDLENVEWIMREKERQMLECQ